jgi:sugar-specific transcriptional regulator TrmB
MKMDLENLQKIGLTKGEIRVYQALLKLGETTKTKLAKESKVAPSNTYDITNRLLEKGIISKVEKNGVAHFSAVDPSHLLHFIEKKEKELNEERKIVQGILPTLQQMFTDHKKPMKVEVFEGWNGLKTVFEELVGECEKGDENYIFGASTGESETKADIFFLKWSRARAKKGIKTKIIFTEEMQKRKKRIDFFLQSKRYNVKFLAHSSPAETMLYKNKTCIIILTEKPLVIRITGQEVMQSYKSYFDVLWKQAK